MERIEIRGPGFGQKRPILHIYIVQLSPDSQGGDKGTSSSAIQTTETALDVAPRLARGLTVSVAADQLMFFLLAYCRLPWLYISQYAFGVWDSSVFVRNQ